MIRFTAECMEDVTKLLKQLPTGLSKITMEIEPPYPDVEVTLQTSLPIEFIQAVISGIEDGHRMLETLK